MRPQSTCAEPLDFSFNDKPEPGHLFRNTLRRAIPGHGPARKTGRARLALQLSCTGQAIKPIGRLDLVASRSRYFLVPAPDVVAANPFSEGVEAFVFGFSCLGFFAWPLLFLAMLASFIGAVIARTHSIALSDLVRGIIARSALIRESVPQPQDDAFQIHASKHEIIKAVLQEWAVFRLQALTMRPRC